MKHHLAYLTAIAVVALCSMRIPVAQAGGGETDLGQLWKAAIITDTQTPDHAKITALLERLKEVDPDIVIHTGDTDFEKSNGFSARAVADLLRTESGWREFHLAPGNHDMHRARLKAPLRLAATVDGFSLETYPLPESTSYLRIRPAEYAPGSALPLWNPEVANHPGWQTGGIARFADWKGSSKSCGYVFKRGRIRFIVCDWAYSSKQRQWLRDVITRPDDSSLSIVLHHANNVGKLSNYFKGLEGRHNVKLVLSGHDHRHHYYMRDGIAYITGAGIARSGRDCDAMVLEVFSDHVRLDRYVIPKQAPVAAVLEPRPIWTRKGKFSEYQRPALPARKPEYVKDSGFGDGVFYEQSK